MGIIQVLDDTLANQIAAGEVVERPASVAKELLENALDAGATTVTIELVGGGVERLRITDNGRGMSPDDAVLALERHATSKVRTADDLLRIMTLGFRGEALPSIASVSRFRVRTREAHALGATLVTVEGGQRRAPTECAGPPGTEVLVEDLFYNVPARRKFLKRADTEAAHVQDIVTQLALAWPHVAFRLVKDGRTTLDLPRHDSLADRVRALFGRETGDRLRNVSVAGAFGLEGLIGLPSVAFGSPRHLHCFVNGRYIRDRVVVNAVQAAYAGALERGRYPFVVLHLRMPPDALDVNVHPAKTEVRFVDSGAVHRFIHRRLIEVLRADDAPPESDELFTGTGSAPPPPTAATAISRRYDLAPEAPLETKSTVPDAEPETAGGLDAHRRRIFDAMERLGARRGFAGPAAPAGFVPAQSARPTSAPTFVPSAAATSDRGLGPSPSSTDQPETSAGTPTAPETVERSPLLAWRPVAAVTPRLGLCLAPDGLVLLDLPAARRALFFHRLRGGAPAVRLASAAMVALGPVEASRLRAHLDVLTVLGFEIEPFGGGSFVVKTLPAGLEGAGEIADLLRVALAEPMAAAAGRLSQRVADAAPPSPTAAEILALLRALAPFESETPRYATILSHGELERRLPRSSGQTEGTS